MKSTVKLEDYTFPSLLKYSCRKYAKKNALSTVDGIPVKYCELEKKAEYVSKILAIHGFSQGDRAAIYSIGRPQWGITYFGIVNYGMIAVPLLTDFSATEVENFLSHCDCKVIFIDIKLYDKIRELDSKLPPVIINIEDFSVLRGEVFSNEKINAVKLPEYEVKEDDTASIIYTSGTTGRSKGVELSHKNLIWSAVSGRSVFKLNSRDRCLSFLPLSHVYEFTVGFTFQLLQGACVYYLGKAPTVSSLLPAFKKIKPTNVESVPMIIEKIYKHKILPQLKKPFIENLNKNFFGRKIVNKIIHRELMKSFGGKLKFFGIGGAKLDSTVEKFLKEVKFPYAIGYGLTETSPLIAAANPKQTRIGSVGPLIPGVEVKLINVKAETGVGEIAVKGPNVMKGYYKSEELTKGVFTRKEDDCGEGWFKTGDLASLEGKYLMLKGRCKNMILSSSGENIYPEDIEFVINSHPLVNESLVVEDDGALVAYIALENEKTNFAQIVKDVHDFVNKKLKATSRINRIKVVSVFEKSATQKIKRYLYNSAMIAPHLLFE